MDQLCTVSVRWIGGPLGGDAAQIGQPQELVRAAAVLRPGIAIMMPQTLTIVLPAVPIIPRFRASLGLPEWNHRRPWTYSSEGAF